MEWLKMPSSIGQNITQNGRWNQTSKSSCILCKLSGGFDVLLSSNLKGMKSTRSVLMCLSVLLSFNPCSQAENYPYKSDYLWVAVPDHDNWVYAVGEKAVVEIMFFKYGIPQEATVEYEIADEACQADVRGILELKKGRAVLDAGTVSMPRFRDIRLALRLDGVTYRHHVKIGFSPEKIQPYTQEPDDFRAWWDSLLTDNKRYPLRSSRELYTPYCTDKVDCYLVRLEVNRSRQAFYGFLFYPKNATKGGHPVVLTPPGAGIKANRVADSKNYYPENGCIRFVIEIHGMNPTHSEAVFEDVRRAFDGRVKGYLYQGLNHLDHYYMKHVYLGLVKCIDYLTSLPEWDGINVAVQGGSQGGGLALVAAGLDARVTQCIVNHPALSDMARAATGGVSGYPHFSGKDGFLTPAHLKTMAYYDVVNFARYVQAKTFMTWGFNDDTCPPTTSYAVWNTLKGNKESLITPINEHWTSESTNRLQLDWLLQNRIINK